MRWGLPGLCFVLLVGNVHADSLFWTDATVALNAGKIDDAGCLADQVLRNHPNDADALVIRGTVTLETSLHQIHDASIFRPAVDGNSPLITKITPDAVNKIATFWKKVPALDPSRAYLWADLAQLAYRSGDSVSALEYCDQASKLPSLDSSSAQEVATVYALNLRWSQAAEVMQLAGNDEALLYQGIDQWLKSQDNWKSPLLRYVQNTGTTAPGHALAAYLTGPNMRDTVQGYQTAIDADKGPVSLAGRQKWAQRYDTVFDARIELARALLQFGSFNRALVEYAEIDRLTLAQTETQKRAVLFHKAWGLQASNQIDQADKIWKDLTDVSEFYVKSAACWFLGANAFDRDDQKGSQSWWSQISSDSLRGKYAAWAAQELKSPTTP